MVMHCGVKRKDSLTNGSLDLDFQQQSLLKLSVHKLQDEQAKYGIEPRLLRFVLINNALRALQTHMVKFDGEDKFNTADDNPAQDSFLLNTINHGLLSSPSSPPTPAKVQRLDGGSPFSSNSPLATCSYPSLGCSEVDDMDRRTLMSLPPLSPAPPVLAERLEETEVDDEEKRMLRKRTSNGFDDGKWKKMRPAALSLLDETLPGYPPSPSNNLIVGMQDIMSPDDPAVNSTTTSTASTSNSSLSPIDFTKVDVSLYDFDARTMLTIPIDAPRNPHPSSLTTATTSCAMQAFITPPLGEINEHINGNGSVCGYSSSSTGSSSGMSANGLDNLVQSPSPLSTDSSEPDTQDEIERIVSMLKA